MRTTLAVLVALLLPRADEKDDLKKAYERTAGLKSYFYQWELLTGVKDRVGKQAGAGEYVAPDLLTVRTGILEVVKKGERSRVRATKGWEDPGDDPKLKDAADRLTPPHELVGYVIESLEKPKREKDAELRKVKCRAWRGSSAGTTNRGANLGFPRRISTCSKRRAKSGRTSSRARSWTRAGWPSWCLILRKRRRWIPRSPMTRRII